MLSHTLNQPITMICDSSENNCILHIFLLCFFNVYTLLGFMLNSIWLRGEAIYVGECAVKRLFTDFLWSDANQSSQSLTNWLTLLLSQHWQQLCILSVSTFRIAAFPHCYFVALKKKKSTLRSHFQPTCGTIEHGEWKFSHCFRKVIIVHWPLL